MSQQFMNILETSWNSNTFVKLSLSKYSGNEDQLKNIYIKEQPSKEDKLSFTYHHQTKDIVKTIPSMKAYSWWINTWIPKEFHIANLLPLRLTITSVQSSSLEYEDLACNIYSPTRSRITTNTKTHPWSHQQDLSACIKRLQISRVRYSHMLRINTNKSIIISKFWAPCWMTCLLKKRSV